MSLRLVVALAAVVTPFVATGVVVVAVGVVVGVTCSVVAKVPTVVPSVPLIGPVDPPLARVVVSVPERSLTMPAAQVITFVQGSTLIQTGLVYATRRTQGGSPESELSEQSALESGAG